MTYTWIYEAPPKGLILFSLEGNCRSDEAPRNPRFVKGHLSRHLSVSGLHGKDQQVEVDPAAMDHSIVTSS